MWVVYDEMSWEGENKTAMYKKEMSNNRQTNHTKKRRQHEHTKRSQRRRNIK